MSDGKPAFLLVTAQITDRGKMGVYAEALAASGLYQAHGGSYEFIGAAATDLENWPAGMSAVCARFPSRAAAEAFWASTLYQDDIKPLREGAGSFQIAIFDGA